jgi:M6 family metalloprotease-like protein
MKRLLVLFLLLPFLASAAPFAEWLDVPVPGGGSVRIWGEGDEYDAYFETEDGHALRVNDEAGRYEYVDLDDETGAYVGTGIFLGDEEGKEARLSALPLHVRDTSEEHRRAVETRIGEIQSVLRDAERWEEAKKKGAERLELLEAIERAKDDPDSPQYTHATSGRYVGITVLVDFPLLDESGNVTNSLARTVSTKYNVDAVDAMMNGSNYTTDGSIASMHDYWETVSDGAVDYNNVVVDWVMAPHPREYYNDTTQSSGTCGRKLIGDILEVMAADPDFDTKYLPKLQQATLNGRAAHALNVIYAGPDSGTWSKGLWPHRWTLTSTQYSKLYWTMPNGTKAYFYDYEITKAANSLYNDTLLHENGHMICGFPDLYAADTANGYGVAGWCLMCYHSKGPAVCAPLRVGAGWTTPQTLPEQGWVTVTSSRQDVWKFANPNNSREFFMIENRQKKGLDKNLKGAGVLIWRADESYSNNQNPVSTIRANFTGHPATNRWAQYLSLEQADGKYDAERKKSSSYGDATDPWYDGNTAPLYTGVFDYDSAACSRWKDGSDSGLRLSHFSASGDTMTFFVGDPSTWPVPFADIRIKSAVGEAATFTAFVESWGTGCSSIDVYAETGSDAAFSTVLSSAKIGTMAQLDSLAEWTVGGLSFGTPHYVRIRLANASGEAVGPVATLDFRLDEDIPPAVDAPEIRFWQTPGNPKNWYVATDKAHKGSSSARSGAVGNNNSTTLNATVDGPGTFSFWWNVSSQGRDSDWLAYTASWDPAATDKIGGTSADWAQVTLEVPAGSQTISWTYRKNASGTGGSDCAWIDDVVWTPDASPMLGPVSASATAGAATLSVPVEDLGQDATSATVSATLGGATKTASVSAAGGTATLVFDGLDPETVYSWSVFATSVPSGFSSAVSTGTVRTASLPATGWFDVEWTTQGWGSGTAWRTAAGEAAAGGTWSVPEGDASSLDGGALSLLPPEGGSLRFTAVSPSDAGGFVKVEGTLSPAVSAEVPEVPSGTLAGLSFALGGFKAWNGAEWIPLSGARPFSSATTWTATFDFRTSPPKVRYAAGGAVLSAQGSEWIPLAVPRNFARGVVFSGGGSLGDFEATCSGGRSAPVLAILAEDGVEPLRFGADPSGAPTFEVTIRNAVAGAWYTVYAADEVGGTYEAVTSVQATANGLLTLSIPAPSDKPARFVRVGVSDSPVSDGTEL